MSLRQRHMHPPDPGPLNPWSTPDDRCIFTLLSDIARYFNSDTANPTTNNDFSLKLSNECNRTWHAIQAFTLTELRLNYRHVEGYRDLIRDIHHAIVANTLTEAETDGFIRRLNDFSREFERIMNNGKTSSPCRSDSVSGPSFLRGIDKVDIQDSILVMNNHQMDLGTSNHLQHIKYILVIQTTFL